MPDDQDDHYEQLGALVEATGPACCGGGDFYGHEPFCDCGHVLAEKATAGLIERLRAALLEARSALSATPPILREAGYSTVAQHVEEVIAECDTLLPANHPDFFQSTSITVEPKGERR